MLYLVIERFKNGDAKPVYRRVREQGRLLPADVTYMASWVTTDMTACYQIVECADASRLDDWIAAWQDLIEFEVIPVRTSAEAQELIAPRL
jgi:hypothetical protein